ncbi:uncharacterized protein BX663DRAFT_484628 [Cokeromyces recurvatus]|uniref:uncharacterized protein n=1 Tax=Cokeromyces recurvatus TaxID=90255 RepID=UPI002220C882|nr:uncharacterized protein BX663DRAFT_484628 [Cokeromyces recurvatus]KAI7904487.1 hypothetical protein BX663DRAFT_484628 [Cokeromyces recurvatus]
MTIYLIELSYKSYNHDNHDEALLHACQRASDSEENKHLARYALTSLKLEHSSIINEHRENENALAHVNVIIKASQSKPASIITIAPMKRSANEMKKITLFCNNCSIINPIPSCNSLASHAPYPKLCYDCSRTLSEQIVP